MARYSGATWDEINGGFGKFTAKAPYRIVHHLTQGTTYVGARAEYVKNKHEPHFTVDGTKVYQHIDTDTVARGLKNAEDGVETGRLNAIQIEVVGLTCKPLDKKTIDTLATLCRWIEAAHGIPQAWPNGLPKPCKGNGDPGGHNRNVENWTTKGGHYGHCHVPENTHWDPAYTAEECKAITPKAPECGV